MLQLHLPVGASVQPQVIRGPVRAHKSVRQRAANSILFGRVILAGYQYNTRHVRAMTYRHFVGKLMEYHAP